MAEVNQHLETTNTQRPTTVAELSEVVRVAASWQNPVLIQAGRTHERFANRGLETHLTLDMTGLDQAIEYSPIDLTLAVQPGMTLAAIDDLLARHDQRLAFDSPHRDRATIGGTFASGLSGPRRLRYGALKDMVIGAEIVNCRGEVAKSGGMVVKNVSGYEVARLHYGAHGAFGIVARLNLKVLPMAESRVEAQISFEDARKATDAGARALVSSLDPAAIYIVGRRAGDWTLHVQFEGSRRFTDIQGQRAIEFIASGRPGTVTAIEGTSTPEFDAIADLTDPGATVVRLSAPASKQAMVLSKLGEYEPLDVLADMGSGLVYTRSDLEAFHSESFEALGVPVAYLAVPDRIKERVDVFGSMDANSLTILRSLKNQYDPDRIFNPGRFVSRL